MKRYKFLPSSPLTIITCILCCLILLGTGVWASTRIWASQSEKSQEIKLRAINKTSALKVVSIRKISNDLPMAEVTLLNQSSKNINCYMLAIGDLMIVADYVPDGAFLAPGQEKVERILMGNFESAAERNPNHAGELIVAAVYFDDRTGEGDARRVEMLRKRYEGAKEQIELVLPVLRDALSSSEDSDSALLTLESQASRLPTESENNKLSPDYREGRDMIKQELDGNIQRLKSEKNKPGFNRKTKLIELVAFYEQLLTRL